MTWWSGDTETHLNDDFKALNYDNFNSSSLHKLNDARIKQFTQLKEQVLDCFGLLISHLRMIFMIICNLIEKIITFSLR